MQKKLHLLIAMLVLMVSTAMAQVTTSSMSGKVTLEASGEDVIGATVQAVHVSSGTKYYAVTNSKGIYSIMGMRPGGPYTITVSYVGAQTKEFTDIALQLGENYVLNTWLSDDAQQLGEVAVVGKAGLAASRTGAAETFSRDKLEELPSINHSVADVARLNPFVKVSENGAMEFAGMNNRYNAIQIDGAMANDAFGLTANGANGGQAGTQPFSMETVSQLQVSIAPFDVRQSGFTGGSINAITKSGTNDFHGSFYTYFTNGGLTGNKYQLHDKSGDSEDYGSMTNYTWGATLGGPIVKDKLLFFANYERSVKEYDNVYSSDNGMSKVDFDLANELLGILKERAAAQGVTYRGTLGTPKEYTYSDKVGLKLDWNINDRNNASLRWSYVDAKQNNNTASASSLVTNDYAYDFLSKTNQLVFQLNSRIGSNCNNELHLGMTNVRDKRNPGDPFPMIQISNVGDGTLYLGNERSSMANQLDQDVYTLTDNFTMNFGRHAITLGTHDELFRFGNLFCQDLYGTYIYSSPDDFKNEVINRYRYGQGVTAYAGSTRFMPYFKIAQLGFYAQDKWNVADNFDLTFGLRIDMPLMIDTPMENAEFNNYSAQQGWGIKTNQKISSKPMWSPRLGFRWDALKNGKLIVRGGVGIFTGRLPYVWLSNNFSNTGVAQMSYSTYSTTDKETGKSVITPQYDASKAGEADPRIDTSAPKQNAQTINIFNKNFRFSQSLRADLAVDFRLLGIDWTAEAIYAKTINDMIVRNYDITATGKNLNTDLAYSYGDNRPMYETSTCPYTGIYVLDNVSKGYSYSASIKADKQFDFGLELMASYTYGLSKTVNNGSSSVAASNWQYNYTHGNPNEPELAKSNFNVPHMVTVSAYEHIKWNKKIGRTIDNVTTIGLIYTGNSGSPYSIYVNGDLNGDGGYNDLMYIPTDTEIDAMVANGAFKATSKFTAEEQGANFKQWLANQDYLKDHRGQYYERNAANEKWENRLDLHFDHKFGVKIGKDIRYIQVGCDIINFTNMLCKKWGATLSQGGYNYYSPLTYSKGSYQFLHDASYDMRSWSDYYSRWRMNFNIKLTF